MTKEELLKLSPGELVDMGICPTCFNRETGGAVYGDNSDKLLYEDSEIECFFVGNPRAQGHMCISTIAHYHDMSEAPDPINEKNHSLCQAIHADHLRGLRLRACLYVYDVRRAKQSLPYSAHTALRLRKAGQSKLCKRAKDVPV